MMYPLPPQLLQLSLVLTYTVPEPLHVEQDTRPLPPHTGQVLLAAVVDVVAEVVGVNRAVEDVVDPPSTVDVEVAPVVRVVVLPPPEVDVVDTLGGGPPTYPMRLATTSAVSSTAAVPQPTTTATMARSAAITKPALSNLAICAPP